MICAVCGQEVRSAGVIGYVHQESGSGWGVDGHAVVAIMETTEGETR